MPQAKQGVLTATLFTAPRVAADVVIEIWDSGVRAYSCGHLAAENRLQIALAQSGSHTEIGAVLLRLQHFGPAARVYLCHHSTLTDLSVYIPLLQQYELEELRKFVLNFGRVERCLTHWMEVTYHPWVEKGYRNALAEMLGKEDALYRGVSRFQHMSERESHQLLNQLMTRLDAHLERAH